MFTSLVTFAKARFLFLFLFPFFGWVACTTAPISKDISDQSQKSSGVWETKVSVKDLRKNEEHHLSVDIIAVRPGQMRMDVSASLGISLATLVLNDNKVQYALYRQKKFYAGPVSDQALLPLFKLRVNPRILMAICFDQAINDPGWSCTQDNLGHVQSCQQQAGNQSLHVQWADRHGVKKQVSMSDGNFEIKILFKSYAEYADQTNVQNDSLATHKDPFQIEAPANFTKIMLPQ